jgi:hypothetical protein
MWELLSSSSKSSLMKEVVCGWPKQLYVVRVKKLVVSTSDVERGRVTGDWEAKVRQMSVVVSLEGVIGVHEMQMKSKRTSKERMWKDRRQQRRRGG